MLWVELGIGLLLEYMREHEAITTPSVNGTGVL